MVKVPVNFSGMVAFQYTKTQSFMGDLHSLDKIILFHKRDNVVCHNHLKKNTALVVYICIDYIYIT